MVANVVPQNDPQKTSNPSDSLREELIKKYGETETKGIDNYFRNVKAKEDFLETADSNRTAFIKKRDAVGKCLAILLDEDLMDFAMYKSSIVRAASNFFIHKHLEDSAVVAEALDNAAMEIVQKADIPKPEKEVVLKLASQSSKPGAILYKDSLYKGEKRKDIGEYSLETVLETKLKEKVVEMQNKKVLTDFVILMKWLEDSATAE